MTTTDEALLAVPLARLRAHPMNSNVMPDDLRTKLRGHIERTGRYPPLVVRPHVEPNAYEVIDGHHRWRVLEALGHATATCVVWDVDDEQALTLLATLNRLEGSDDPKRRAAIVTELHERFGRAKPDLAKMLPETSAQVAKLIDLSQPPPPPAKPHDLADVPIAVHFFLLPQDRKRLNARLAEIGGTREQALMRMVGEATERCRDEGKRKQARHGRPSPTGA